MLPPNDTHGCVMVVDSVLLFRAKGKIEGVYGLFGDMNRLG